MNLAQVLTKHSVHSLRGQYYLAFSTHKRETRKRVPATMQASVQLLPFTLLTILTTVYTRPPKAQSLQPQPTYPSSRPTESSAPPTAQLPTGLTISPLLNKARAMIHAPHSFTGPRKRRLSMRPNQIRHFISMA